MTLPPIRPMTVSISTHEEMPLSSMNAKKSAYILPRLASLGTLSVLFIRRGLNLTTLGNSTAETDRYPLCRCR
jgi:hypothetical protein